MNALRQKFLVDAPWLQANLSNGAVKTLDATWLLPTLKRDARAEFAAEHIVGARFFDLDDVSDATSPYPHMLPSSDVFGAKVGALGISNSDHVVVYDTLGLFSAARCWCVSETKATKRKQRTKRNEHIVTIGILCASHLNRRGRGVSQVHVLRFRARTREHSERRLAAVEGGGRRRDERRDARRADDVCGARL